MSEQVNCDRDGWDDFVIERTGMIKPNDAYVAAIASAVEKYLLDDSSRVAPLSSFIDTPRPTDLRKFIGTQSGLSQCRVVVGAVLHTATTVTGDQT